MSLRRIAACGSGGEALNRGSTTVAVTCEDRRATAVVIVFVAMGV